MENQTGGAAQRDMFYPASLSMTAVAVTVLFAAVVPVSLLLVNARVFGSALAVLFAVIFALAWLLHPLGYALFADKLVVDRLFLKISIPYASITDIDELPDSFFNGSVRFFGAGGVFGWFGWYWKKGMGVYILEASRTSGFVLIKAGTDYVLTPDDTDGFMAELARRLANEGLAAQPHEV
ncbi:MAG: PH domain-containing protein [Elusimicrobiales bacterium]|nr:PH domain-containing protein [Elusimicrobiales bacterium]